MYINDSDIPEPDAPPTSIDPELERLLTWFIRKNKRIAWSCGCERLVLEPRDNPKNKTQYELVLVKVKEM